MTSRVLTRCKNPHLAIADFEFLWLKEVKRQQVVHIATKCAAWQLGEDVNQVGIRFHAAGAADQDQAVNGQKAAWGNKPCHGDVFHIQHQCEALANTLTGVAKGAMSRRKKLQAKNGKVRQPPDLAERIALALQAEAGAHVLAGDIRTLTAWLAHDVLALAGPSLDIRKNLFDFIVAELGRREADDPRRIRPVRIALQNQRDDLLAFAGVLDDKLATTALVHDLPEHIVRAACVLYRKPSTSPTYWQGWNRLRARMGATFHVVFDAVAQAMAQTPRSSPCVKLS